MLFYLFLCLRRYYLARAEGIEPPFNVLETFILPLEDARNE
jgi:hypothetical protein